MVRDKNPTLQKTCVICRSKISVNLKLHSYKPKGASLDPNSSQSDAWHLKAMFMESFSMAFGLPVNHPFMSIFINKSVNLTRGRLCYVCFEDVSTFHHIFWQLQSLENKLSQMQSQFLQRLRSNYDAISNAILFSSLGANDLVNKLEQLKYDEVVKIMFEQIKDTKEEWPKSQYSLRWKQACDSAKKIAQDMQNHLTVCLTDTFDSKSDSIVRTEDIKKVITHPLAEDHDYLNISPPGLRSTVIEEADPFYIRDASNLEAQDKDCVIPEDDFLNDCTSQPIDDEDSNCSLKIIRKKRRRRPKAGKAIPNLTKKRVVRSKKETGMRFLCVEDPEVCSRTYSSRKHLSSHIKTFHRVRKFICDYEGCSGRYETEEKLEAHKARVHEKVGLTEVCEACGIELPRKDMKRHYYLRHVGIGKFSCEVCSMDFNDSDVFQNHEQLHKQSEYPFSCVVCQKLFTNSIDLRGHVTSNHLSSGLKCEVCGIMKPNDFLLRRHMKIHEKVKSFTCSECGKTFTSRAYLNYHMEHNHENAGKRYPCEVCGKTFSYLKNCLRHMVCHQEEKPYKCKICPKTFNYSHLLKKHEEIHSNTRNYGCEICGKRFRQEQNLRQHMRSHKPKPEKQQTNKKSGTKQNELILDKVENDSEALMEIKIDTVNGSVYPEEVGKLEEELETKPETIIAVPSSVQVSTTGTGQLVIPSSQVQPVHQIQLTLPAQQQQQQGTTTVVFVTADQNFHWIA